MEYRELPAEPALAEDVACVWYDNRVRPSTEHRAQLVTPDGCIDIVWLRGQAPIVAGPATVPIQADLPPDATLIGLRFRTGRAPAFLGVPADALLNLDVPLRELWGGTADRLHDELEGTSSIADALTTLQAAVGRKRAAPADPLVQAALRQLRRSPRGTVRDLGDGLGLSERQLLRRFTASVGYGPRTLARVLRFRRFLGLLVDPHARAWDFARLAAESGFADHAHLARDCASLAGLTPSQLRRVWAPGLN
ncbi:MAG TPA: helix-turn-helix domain-containing protein [Chloroflexota bacterium]|nr:helix-turn-helix domain-containing protein [Chloroflexota bacterium]